MQCVLWPVLQLREVSLTVLTNNECRAAQPALLEDQICAGGQEGEDGTSGPAQGTCEVGIECWVVIVVPDKRLTCQGDTGGPLTVDTRGQEVLVGVTSYNSGKAGDCAQVITTM